AVAQPNYSTKPIVAVIDETHLPSALVELTNWLSSYYLTPVATVLQTVLPAGLTKKRRDKSSPETPHPKRNRTNIVFNKEQRSALDIITKSEPGTFLLQGVTGSGKTEIYKEL